MWPPPPAAAALAFTELTALASGWKVTGKFLEERQYVRCSLGVGSAACVHQADALPSKNTLGKGRLLGVRASRCLLMGGWGALRATPRLQRSPSESLRMRQPWEQE